VPASLKDELKRYIEEDFAPFDPVSKRTVAIVRGPDGARFKVSKGAPQVTLRMSWNKDEIAGRVKRDVDELAARGFRSLGVAVSRVDPSLGEAADKWEYLGVLSLFDPPRPDSKQTIEHAIDNGVMVKMITGACPTCVCARACVRCMCVCVRVLGRVVWGLQVIPARCTSPYSPFISRSLPAPLCLPLPQATTARSRRRRAASSAWAPTS